MYSKTNTLFLTSILILLPVFPLLGQSQRDEEAQDYYRKWLDEDVVYVITPEEKAVFENLTTADEKDQFIEQFWRRRDPDPRTSENEFKEEHYRRIAYANERFHAGVAGWRTDRGMVYIRWGKPTGVEKHPQGGSYQRKISEGGGITYTYPFEVWFYNHIDEIGSGIEIEFVDFSRTNEYRIATDVDQKDALFWVPNAGQTMAEQFGTMSRLDRLRARLTGNPEGGARGLDTAFYQRRYQDYPLQKLETIYKLQKSPPLKYKDLEKIVTTRVHYDQLPMKVQAQVLRLSDSRSMVPVTIFLDNRELSFRPTDQNRDWSVALMAVYGQVETLSGRITYTFEEDIERRFRTDELGKMRDGVTAFQKQFPLEPGRYKLSLAVQDTRSGKMGTLDHLLVIPRNIADTLQTSPVLLATGVSLPESDDSMGEPFVLGKYRVVPAPDDTFTRDEQFAQAYFEVYNLGIDQETLKPETKVEIALLRGASQVFPWTPINQEFEFDRDRLLVYKTIPFQGLQSGAYTLQFRITDRVKQRSVTTDVEFVMQ